LAEFSNGIVLGVTIYCGVLWFLGVGLATTLTLAELPIVQNHYIIGGLVGVITIYFPILLTTYFVQRILLKTTFVRLM